MIAQLPAELLHNYTLQYRGAGLQGASWEAPRAVLFGHDAKFVITFNGSSAQSMGDALEVLQFNEVTAEFELYQIDLPLAGEPRKNPASCMQCHATKAGAVFPIWGSYSFWDGAYGSNEDMLLGKEAVEFKRNKPKWREHPRYKHLTDEVGSPVAPYSTVQVQTMTFRPNANLGSFLQRLNAKAIAKRLTAQPGWEHTLYAMSPTAFHCGEAGDIRDEAYAWGMMSAKGKHKNPYFLDTLFQTTPNYVIGQLAEPFFAAYPKLRSAYEEKPMTEGYKSSKRLVQSERDWEILYQYDALGVPMNLKKGTCL